MATGQALLYLVLDRKGQLGSRGSDEAKPDRLARTAPSVASAGHLCGEDAGFENELPGPQACA